MKNKNTYSKDGFKKHILFRGLSKIEKSWFEENTLDKWRHKRMLEPVKAFIGKNSTWLTIGDGRFGTEARFINDNGGTAHASDINIELLAKSKDMGYINKYSAQNAENLSFKSNKFDYVLIKEAVHHFEKPWKGLYEAFRVAKIAVIIIEPKDTNPHGNGLRKKLFNFLKYFIKYLFKKNPNIYSYSFEEVGNFVYSMENRELEKFILGMNHNHYAHKELNDYYFPGVEFVEENPKNLKDFLQKFKLRINIFLLDIFSNLGLTESNLTQIVLFKKKPSSSLIKKMRKYNWKYRILPKNPFKKG